MVIDSQFDRSELILQNPARPCPDEILESLEVLNVVYVGFDGDIHQGQIVVAAKVAAEVAAFFRRALETKFPIERVIPVSAPPYRWDGKKVLADNLTSGFDYRNVHATDKQSKHSFGLALDVNPRQNPYIRYKDGIETLHVPEGVQWNPDTPGTLTADNPLVKLMVGFGWQWGGSWTKASGRIDYMHFEKE